MHVSKHPSQPADPCESSGSAPRQLESWLTAILATTAVAYVLATAACGSGGSSPSQPPVTKPPTPHSVALKWAPSNTPNVSGYNVYRADYKSSCQAFQKINNGLVATTAYTDTVVADGSSYCYAATTVDSAGAESALSAYVQVTIPAN